MFPSVGWHSTDSPRCFGFPVTPARAVSRGTGVGKGLGCMLMGSPPSVTAIVDSAVARTLLALRGDVGNPRQPMDHSFPEPSFPASPAIKAVLWSVIPSHTTPPRIPSSSTLVAIWPAPWDLCQCMVKAGFPDLGPVDSGWDLDWRKMVERILACLGTFGTPSIITEIEVYEFVSRSGLAAILDYFPCSVLCGPRRKRLSLSLIEQLLFATDDDRLGDAVVGFGNPPSISLSMGFGHPIFWLSLPTESLESTVPVILAAVADGRRVTKTDVHWETWFGA